MRCLLVVNTRVETCALLVGAPAAILLVSVVRRSITEFLRILSGKDFRVCQVSVPSQYRGSCDALGPQRISCREEGSWPQALRWAHAPASLSSAPDLAASMQRNVSANYPSTLPSSI